MEVKDRNGKLLKVGDRVRVERERALLPGSVEVFSAEVVGFEGELLKVTRKARNAVRLVRPSECRKIQKTPEQRERQESEARIAERRAALREADVEGKVRKVRRK